MEPPQRDDNHVETDGERRLANLVLLAFIVALLGAGYWLINAMVEQRTLDDCLAQGRHNCAPVETSVR